MRYVCTNNDIKQFCKTQRQKDGLQERCTPCRNKFHSEKGYITSRKTQLRKKFGVTTKWYEDKLAQQNNCCAICGQIQDINRKFAIDHDHSTGEVRGLLCHLCNMSIGGLKDDIEILMKAIEYLRSYKRSE